jgi:hypothetical protein
LLTAEDVCDVIEGLGDLVIVLAKAKPGSTAVPTSSSRARSHMPPPGVVLRRLKFVACGAQWPGVLRAEDLDGVIFAECFGGAVVVFELHER